MPKFPLESRWLIRGALLGFSSLAATTAFAAQGDLPAVIEFNRHVRPIMSNTCFKCHGPDVKSNKGDLRLDLAELAAKPHTNSKGRVTTPIVAGQPEKSEVWRRVASKDPGEIMPPVDSLHQLGDRDKAILRRWIEQGAKYQPHWSYLAPVKAPLPAGAESNPVDRFVRAELASRGIKASPEAERRTLGRRVTLDLTGLPPTPAQMETFLADTQPGAYERLVDRLLASPHYGERMAVPWLDLVRFADTVGFHGDQRQNVFPYRDYVVDAFNRDKPFDQFTREQLAGDLLPGATAEQRVASGYNRLNMMTREGGAQPKEYLAKYAADRVRTVSTTFLGSTLACAECHDHKYDPFSTRDFYSMEAYFADIKQWGVYNDYKYTPEPELTGFNNDFPFPPEILVENPALQKRLERLRERFGEDVATVAQLILADPTQAGKMSRFAAAVATRLGQDPQGWSVATVESVKANSANAATLPDQSVRFETPPPATGPALMAKPGEPAVGTTAAPPVVAKPTHAHVLTLRAPVGPLAVVRVEALPDEAHGGFVGRDQKETFTLGVKLAVLRAGETKSVALELADAYADGATQSYSNGYLPASLFGNWVSARSRAKEPQGMDYFLQSPIELAEGDRLVATLTSADLARVRLAVSPLGGRLPAMKLGEEERAAFTTTQPTDAERALVANQYFLGTGAGNPASFAAMLGTLREIADCREGKAFTMVTAATTPSITRVLARGNWQDETGEVVAPEPPRFLTGALSRRSSSPVPVQTGAVNPGNSPTRATRLDLANWITSRDNPLTARTYVNRLWKQFFGIGLSAAVDDLGMQGEYPSHPELLDWLAVDFMDHGWEIKAMVRLIVTSATYRQSSVNRPELREIDPQNRLLARQSPRRLDAEFVRDNALAAAGLLDDEVGGPSATPYQPEDYYAQLNFPLREYQAERDERQYRRGLYTHWQRTFLHPMLANFDAPSREECTATRTLSSTPQQALTLLNDPTFVEAARVLAERTLLEAPGQFETRLDFAFRALLARPPSARELASLRQHYDSQLAVYRAAPDDARKLAAVGLHRVSPKVDVVDLAAWTSVTRVLVNLNEAIVVY